MQHPALENNLSEKEAGPCQGKVKPSIGQRVSDRVAKVIRSWTFILVQVVLITAWMLITRFCPSIAWDDNAFDVLRLVLAIEGSFIGSILLMAAHRQSDIDRRVVYNDFCMELKIRRELKEMRPMIEELVKKASANKKE